jgi:hypothetical protein
LTTIQGFTVMYDRLRSAAENYQARPFVQALLNPYLRDHRPEHFREVMERHDAGIAVLESQIQAL